MLYLCSIEEVGGGTRLPHLFRYLVCSWTETNKKCKKKNSVRRKKKNSVTTRPVVPIRLFVFQWFWFRISFYFFLLRSLFYFIFFFLKSPQKWKRKKERNMFFFRFGGYLGGQPAAKVFQPSLSLSLPFSLSSPFSWALTEFFFSNDRTEFRAVPSFYRVLLGFPRQYRVLLGFSTVLPRCTEFYWVF